MTKIANRNMKKTKKHPEITTRSISDLRDVLYQQESKDGKRIVYQVWRNQKAKDNLRYDITIIFPRLIGKELAKTYGHYHLNGESEWYEILNGQAIFLFQKPADNYLKIKENYAVFAKRGDKVIVPLGYGMTMINRGRSELKVGNWIKNDVKNVYTPYKKMHGASYYCLKEENQIKFAPNPHYQKNGALKIVKPRKVPTPLRNLQFLVQPLKYKKLLTAESLFR